VSLLFLPPPSLNAKGAVPTTTITTTPSGQGYNVLSEYKALNLTLNLTLTLTLTLPLPLPLPYPRYNKPFGKVLYTVWGSFGIYLMLTKKR
jgi:hypothetical protein